MIHTLFNDELLASLQRDEDEDMLHGTVWLFGVPHHVMLLKVAEDKDGIQYATLDPHERFLDFLSLNEGKLYTMEVPGHPGDWVLCSYPHAH